MTPLREPHQPNRARAALALTLAILCALSLALTAPSAAQATAPHPAQLLFTRQVCDSDADPCWEIVVADRSDTHETVVAGPYPRSVWDDHFLANWSPDGRHIAFMADLGSGHGLWQVNADGSGMREILHTPANTSFDDGVAYTADGRSLIFTRCCPRATGYALWRVNLDGTNLRPVTHENVPPQVDGPADGGAEVAPNGQMIGYQRDADGGTSVAVANLSGGDRRVLTPSGFDAQIPNWSSDGRTLVFQSLGNVWSVSVAGRQLTQITHENGDDTRSVNPSYAPDGSRIIYAHRDADGSRDLFTMKPDGTGQERLSTTDGLEFFPHYSPTAF